MRSEKRDWEYLEDFEKQKSKVMNYIMFKKRTEYEVRQKFSKTMNEDMLDDIIQYIKEAGYLNDKEYIEYYGIWALFCNCDNVGITLWTNATTVL